MALYVNTNVSALNGQKNLTNVTNRMNSSFEKLSSGSRINSAKDDAAGLQISDRLTTQIIGLEQGTRNANDGISIAQIAEGALSEVTNNVQRMRQLVVQGGNRTLSHEDRQALGDEFSKLLDVNDDISERTAFGTMKILNYNSPRSGFQIQSGAQSGEQDTVTTGNAKLTSMFGDLLIRESATGNLSAFFNASGVAIAITSAGGGFPASTLTDAGTLGELVAAHMVRTGESLPGNALLDLFGVPAGDGSLLFDVNVSTIALQSELQLDADVLTNLLIGNGGNGATVNSTNLNAIQGLSAVANNYFNFLASQMTNLQDFVGSAASIIVNQAAFSDDNMNNVNAFVTDTLLDMMSGLVTEVDRMRAKMGAEQNGLASTIRSNTTAVVNVSDSRSRITDTDFAKETAELTRNQIIQQASTSILAQANQLPQAALTLLG